MKRGILVLFGLISLAAYGQITVTSPDMPSVFDRFRMSSAIDLTIDFESTGANYNWDFSDLTHNTQTDDTFTSVFNTPLFYQFFFSNPFDPPHIANFALRGQSFDLAGQFTLSNVFNFFKVTGDTYQEVGFGAQINVAPIPVPYEAVDTIFQFPMNFGDLTETQLAFTLQIPTFGAYASEGQRENEVDGWGTLTTPYGTFDVLRVKSQITREDSVFVEALQFGFAFPRPVETQYKWIAKDKGVPVLQINTLGIAGNEVVQSITYPDSMRVTLSIENLDQDFEVQVFPNPVSDQVQVSWEAGVQVDHIDVFDYTGKHTKHVLATNNPAQIDLQDLPAGIYVLQIWTGDQRAVRQLIKQ